MSSIVQTNPVITGIGGAAKIEAVLTSTSKVYRPTAHL